MDQSSIHILGLRGKGTAFYENKIRAKSIKHLFLSCTDIVNQFPEEERYNLFYTLSHFREGTKARDRNDFDKFEILPIDIDGIDTSKLDTYIELISNTLGLDQARTGMVASGNGLHFLIELDQPITKLEDFKTLKPNYKTMCDEINAALESRNLAGNADPKVFEPIRILRLPMTKNIKPGKGEKYCRLINAMIEKQGFKLENFAAKLQESKTVEMPISFDTPAILKECNFLVKCKENPNAMSEPQWFDMIGILQYLEHGNDLVHEYSKDYYGYTFEETQRKLEGKNATGPTLCSTVNEDSEACQTCKWNGKISTPLMIKGKDFIKTKDSYFHDVAWKDGVPKITKPNFPDLYKQWKKEFEHISINGNIYIYKDTHWQEFPKDYILNWAANKFGDHNAAYKLKEFYEGWVSIRKLKDASFFDRDEPLVNCKNGVVNFQTGEFMEHDKKYGFTHCAPFDYDPDAECPTWDKVMQTVTMERPHLVDVMEEYFGYAFSNSENKWHKCLVLLGDGSNGKSTILQTLKDIAGNGCSTLDLSEIGGEYHRMRIVGKLFNVSEETPKKSLADSSLFKRLVSGESFTARNPYGKPIEVRENRCKLIMATNDLPYNNDTSSGFARRFIIVPFDYTFTAKDADYNIQQKLDAEHSGIFNRLMQGYKRLVKQGNFTDSIESREILEDYRLDSNPIAAFAGDLLQEDENGIVENRKLYVEYVKWCDENNIPKFLVKTNRMFFKELKRTCPFVMPYKSNSTRGYKNVTLIGTNNTF